MTNQARCFSVPREVRGQRLDAYLAALLPTKSRTRIQELIREGQVSVNNVRAARPGTRLRGGETVAIKVVERPPLEAAPEEIPLSVLYEDEDLVAIDKPAGMVVHVGAGIRRGTLVNALLYHFRQLSHVGGRVRPGIVHRLDKNTSGVLLAAKNDEAHRLLAEQFSRRQVEKKYLALVHGRLRKEQGVIRLPVARDRVRRTRMTTRRREGRAAETEYRVLESAAGFTLVEALLHTGRTHQVRVHFSSLGHPVVGDTLYGAPRLLRWGNQSRRTLDRNFLHAQRIRFRHPRSGEQVEVQAPIPEELSKLLRVVGIGLPEVD